MPKNRFRLIVRAHWRDKKIGEFSGNVHIYSKREVLKINRFPLVVFFRKKFSRAESCAEDFLVLCMEFILLFANKKGRYLRTTLNVYTTE